ncbi:MAG TPA: SRPBCC family protein [Solirubrobacteraceae bacterium]|nr:SRPBCC family protein [Solirubrobacteraceae bacterium]
MEPITLSISIAKPREEVFEYLADVANHAEFSDHCMVDWHLTREDSYGHGAGARFRVKSRFDRFSYGDITLSQVTPPERIVATGRAGRFNRIRTLTTWTLEEDGPERTTVTFQTQSTPALKSDELMEKLLFVRASRTRCHKRALARLRSILEAGEGRGEHVTLAGGARKPASGFRL